LRLHRITLNNFRQFRGEQVFDLSTQPGRPVSLIFGGNGAGKTTLLNAFTWALYGTLSDDLEEPDKLVTDIIWRTLPVGEAAEVSVELTFDHEGHDYRVLRRAEQRKRADEQQRPAPEVKLWRTQADGSSEMVGNPQDQIFAILPPAISRFFFFNGERIEKLVQKGAYAEVQQDIKALLDLKQVERALEHLPKVGRRLSQDITRRGGERASGIQTEIDELSERETEHKEELKVLTADLAILNEERERTKELLRQNAATAQIQQQLDTAMQELEEASTARDTANEARATLIATKGFLAFTDDLITTTANKASALYQRGTLPSPLKREFVDKLLEDGECICGTALTDHDTAWTRVQEWRQKAGLQAVEIGWQQLSGQMAAMSGARVELHTALQDVLARIATEDERVLRATARASELKSKLRGTRLEDVQQLVTKNADLDQRIGAKREQKGRIEQQLEVVRAAIEQKHNELNKAEVTDELAAKARARADLVRGVQQALDEILAIRAEDMRRRLDAELKDIFGKITIKQYVPRLSEDFELALYQDVDGKEMAVPKSTGENQILSLSFVAAVSKLAREIRKERRAEGDLAQEGGTYPIVMDAAFGSLDENYQREVANALAQIAPQLVVLVSKSQGLGEVVNQLRPHVSRLGVIVTNTTTASDVNEDIELDGVAYPYIRSSADANHAELQVIM
jgi:DNA sulfur modification protein DndD